MTRPPRARYHRAVATFGNGAARRVAAGAVFLALALVSPLAARAAASSIDVRDQALVMVWSGNRSELTIRAWDKPTVQVETDDEAAQISRSQVTLGTPQSPLSVAIPLRLVKYKDAAGNLVNGTLPPEDFPFPAEVRAGVHDQVKIVTGEGARVTVMVPNSAAILDARVFGAGIMSIDDYHGATLFANMAAGRMNVNNVATTAFLQPVNGQLHVNDSTFDRLRVRANTAALVFEHARSRQIEVSTMSGPIVYDNGTFDAGLARFESTTGHIAIGVASNAQVSARSGDGRVYGLWDRKTALQTRGDNEASATVGTGGPVVNAVTGHGNVYLYDGSLASRRTIPSEWRGVSSAVKRMQASAPDGAPRAIENRLALPEGHVAEPPAAPRPAPVKPRINRAGAHRLR